MRIGTYIKKQREEKRISLWSFCQQGKFDSSFISKLERGIIDLPSEFNLKVFIDILHLSDEEYHEMREIACNSNIVKLPDELMFPFKHMEHERDYIKLMAIVNMERLDQDSFQELIYESFDTLEQRVLFSYFNLKINDLKQQPNFVTKIAKNPEDNCTCSVEDTTGWIEVNGLKACNICGKSQGVME